MVDFIGLVGWLGWILVKLIGWLVGWLVGWLGWILVKLIGWLVGFLVGWLDIVSQLSEVQLLFRQVCCLSIP